MIVRINLLPQDVQPKKTPLFSKRRIPYVLFAAIITASLAVTGTLFLMVAHLQKQIDALEQPYKRAVTAMADLAKQQKENNSLQKRIDALNRVEPGLLWSSFLKEIQHSMPQGIYLTDISGRVNGTLIISGESTNCREIGVFVFALEDIDAINRIKLEKVDLNDEAWPLLYTFQINCQLKNTR